MRIPRWFPAGPFAAGHEVKGLVLVLRIPICRTDGWEKGVLRAYRAECAGSMPEVRPRRRIDS